MRPFGLFLILASLMVPLFAFAQLVPIHPNTPLAAQYLGVASLIAMAFGQIMATRLPGVEVIFGPMDKTYVLHKWLGIFAVATMLLHDTIGAEIKNLGPEGTWSDFGENLGELGMNGILVLVGASLALFIPYKWWRVSHKFIGGFFVLSALHFVMIDKPFAVTDPIGLYVLGICLLGVLSYAITLLPMWMRRPFDYEVVQVTQTGSAASIQLSPRGKPMPFRAGQFAFFRFEQMGNREPHPFTLSAAPCHDGTLRISVKGLGRYTRRLGTTLETGTHVSVQGPFGRFGSSNAKSPEIWVAAGIGITPFAAMLGARGSNRAPVELFYTFRGAQNAPLLDEVTAHVSKLPNVTLTLIDTTVCNRLTADQIAKTTALNLAQTKVMYCGPTPLRDSLREGLRAHGVPRRRFHYEEFEIRSDIWPLRRVNTAAKTLLAKLGI